jgi:glycosyltransferase involved in cell wall biosynthesis
MENPKLSIVIPSYKDPFLWKTINDLLEKTEGQIEIIAVFDGYWPEAGAIKQDPRVRYVHLGKNRGMRGAINAGVSVARGEFIMRADEHCMFAKGFDKAITDVCQLNWIMTAVRYFLDPVKWERMDIPPFIYEKLKIRGGEDGSDEKFEGQRWPGRDERNKDIMVDETMAMQGSFWIMPRKWWNEVIGELQTEGYGPHFQDSHEMVFKTWKAGGKLMVNKNTWFAHKHKDFSRTHQEGTKENPGVADQSYAYCLKLWKDYYLNEICPKWFLQ